jgi:hypothetical protein
MRLVLDIAEHRANFFLELLHTFDFVNIEADATELTFEEKQLIEARLQHHAENKDKSILWSDLKMKLEQTL